VAKTYEFEFDAPPEQLINETVSAVSALGFSILHNEDTATSVTFNTGASIWSTAGQDMTVTALALSETASKLIVSGRTAQKGKEPQYGSWGERGRIAKGLATRVRGALADSSGEQPSSGSHAFVEELEALVELHRSGELTDTEFANAKRRLLSS
jgi:hypothetical protein